MSSSNPEPTQRVFSQLSLDVQVAHNCSDLTSYKQIERSLEHALLVYLCHLNGSQRALVTSILKLDNDENNAPAPAGVPESTEVKQPPAAIPRKRKRFERAICFLLPGTYLLQFQGKPFTVHYKEHPSTLTKLIRLGKLQFDFNPAFTEQQVYALFDEAYDYAFPPHDQHVSVQIYNDGSWQELSSCRARALDTVYLPAKDKDLIVNDLKTFLSHRKLYEDELGIPYKRIYCLAGKSGAGKSSLVYALASEFDFNICIVNFGHGIDDTAFFQSLASLDDRSILLLEDIDCAFPARADGSSKVATSFSGLLNALDGVAARSSLIVFMTTNHLDRLDPALLRPSRTDIVLKFGDATEEQVRAMFARMLTNQMSRCDEFCRKVDLQGVTMSMLQKLFIDKRYCDNIVKELPFLYALRTFLSEYRDENRPQYLYG